MSPRIAFLLSIVLSFAAWSLVAARYVWPRLRALPLPDALRPILLLHSFRFVGLAFIIPGVVAADLPHAFAQPAAYGDLATTILALASLAMLHAGAVNFVLVLTFNVVGAVDLLYAYYQGNATGLGDNPGLQGAAYFIPTVLVPLLLVTHALVFRLLFGRRA